MLIVCAVLGFCLPAFSGVTVKAEETQLVAGTDFTISVSEDDLKVDGFTFGTNVANGVVGSDHLTKSFITVKRGEICVLKFAQPIDTAVYKTAVLNIKKNISSDAILAFYENREGAFACRETGYMGAGDAAYALTLSLEKYADDNGTVESIIVQHQSDLSATDVANFQIVIFQSQLSTEGQAEEQPSESKTFIAGEDFKLSATPSDLRVADLTLTNGVANGIIGKDGKNKSFAYVLRGQAVIVGFSQPINAGVYDKFYLNIAKNITSNAEFGIYKNGFGETEPVETVTMNTGTLVKTVEISLSDYADAGGYVDGLVIEHITDSLDTEVETFQILVYDSPITVKEPAADYDLAVNGSDMSDGNTVAAGGTQKQFVVSTDTSKLYCNGFIRNCYATLSFGKPIDVSKHKTLSLTVFMNGFTTEYTFYLELYKTSVTDFSSAVPAGRMSFVSGKDVTFEIDLTDFADEYGLVDGIVFYHYDNTREGDTESTSFWIKPSRVLLRNAEPTPFFWRAELESADYADKFDGENNLLTLTFTDALFGEKETEVTDGTAVRNFADNLILNGEYLSQGSGAVKYITGYGNDPKKLGLVFRREINGDGGDVIAVLKDAPVKSGGCVYRIQSVHEYVLLYNETLQTYSAPECCAVAGVTSEYGESGANITVEFTKVTGETQGVSERIAVNGITVSEIAGATVTAEENAINIFVPITAGALKSDGKDELTVFAGALSDRIYLVSESKYYRYDASDGRWFVDDGKTFYVLGFAGFSAKNDYIVKFTLRLSAETGSAGTDISDSSALKRITVNGKSLYDISRIGELKAVYQRDTVEFTVERAVLGFNGNNDVIIIHYGFALPTGGKSEAIQFFRYDADLATFTEYDIEPEDPAAVDKAGCSGSISGAGITAVFAGIAFAVSVFAIKRKKED